MQTGILFQRNVHKSNHIDGFGGNNHMKFITVLIAGLLSYNVAWADNNFGCEKQDIGPIFGGAADASGTSKLCVLPGGVNADLNVNGLIPGDVVTVWWVYIDDPNDCMNPGMCADPDFFGVKPVALFGRMGSGMVSKQGRVEVSGTWGAMKPSAGSQVWTLMFTHGEAGCAGREIGEGDGECRSEGDALARQTLTPEDSDFPPQLGNAVDGKRFFGAAIAVFQM
ncbi:MAG: hypothetical protein OES38_06765 [Gammaproteobacteria bacterium]|nr:hypothetical protein [Gammaproteobacteria bacterium]